MVLKMSDKGQEVKQLQDYLGLLGFLDYVSTGTFAKLTYEAVIKAQESYGLEQKAEVTEEFFETLKTKVQEITLWNKQEIKELEEFQWLNEGDNYEQIVDICRNRIEECKRGSLFYTLDNGFYANIEQNLKQLSSKGASIVLVNRKLNVNIPAKLSVVYVKDTNEALLTLAKNRRENIDAKVIAVTGSAGKTSTVSILGQILQRFGKTYNNTNNMNLLNMIAHCLMETPKDVQYGIYEVGAMPKAMVDASKLISPNIVMYLGSGDSHLEYMHSQLIVADIKSQLFFAAKPNGTAIINRDDRFYKRVKEAASEFWIENIITFGEHKKSDVRLIDYIINEKGTKVLAEVFGQEVEFKINLQGKHWVMNILAVIASSRYLGIDFYEMLKYLKKIKPVSRRGEKFKFNIDGKNIVVYNDSFNANPLSLRTSIKMIEELPVKENQRKILILGQMAALGEYSLSEHLKLAEFLNSSNVDKIYTCSTYMDEVSQKLDEDKKGFWEQDIQSLSPKIIDELKDGDVVLLKGSRINKMEYFIKYLRDNFEQEK